MLLIIAGALYLIVLAVLFFSQKRLLFPRAQVASSPLLPPNAERLLLKVGGGERLVGTHISPAPSTRRPVLLGFGGNATNAGAMALLLHDMAPASDVVTFYYRGYAPSEGSPSAAALATDAVAIYDAIAARFPGRPIVAVGFSLGTGVAAQLARRRTLAGLILVTPFDSLEHVVASHYPWVPIRLLFTENLDSDEALRGLAVPIAIIAAENDQLVPKASTDGLRKVVTSLVMDRTIPDCGHNDIYDRPAFRQAFAQALGRLNRNEIDP